MSKLPKPHRPFGLSLGIIAGLLLIVVIPGFELVWVAITNNVSMLAAGEFIGGVDVVGVNTLPLLGQGVVSISYLVACVLVWRGRPSAIGWIWPGVMLVAVVYIVVWRALPTLLAQPTLADGLDSAQSAQRAVLTVYTVGLVLLTLYSLWFVRRWSARAFFRGYYTERDAEILQDMGVATQD